MRRVWGLSLTVALLVSAQAQAPKSVKVEFASEGDHEVWIAETANPGVFKDPVSATGLSITLDAPPDAAPYSVYAHDKKTGNVASKPLSDAMKAGSWKVVPADEKRVFRLQFNVVSDGKPVAAAVVKATAGKETREALLTPDNKGTVNVYNLPVGTVEVRVQYNAGGRTSMTQPQSFEAKLGEGPAKPHTLTINETVETVAETAAPGGSKAGTTGSQPDGAPNRSEGSSREPDRRDAPAPNPLLSLLNLVIGLAVVGGIGYGVYVYYKKNTKQVDDALKKFGIGDQPPQDTAPAAPLPQQPQPLKPIVLDDAAPSAVVSPMAPMSVAVASNPRLVRPDGSVVLLQEGPTTVGRDEGLGLSLVGESSVSRQHARFDRTGDTVRLTDLGSTNGTFVNGARLQGEATVTVGDAIQFGAVAFRFEA